MEDKRSREVDGEKGAIEDGEKKIDSDEGEVLKEEEEEDEEEKDKEEEERRRRDEVEEGEKSCLQRHSPPKRVFIFSTLPTYCLHSLYSLPLLSSPFSWLFSRLTSSMSPRLSPQGAS